ncbi:hypothetical protein ACEPPU_14540 [Priestia aryabhattai]|uniref:hypothetical protein n=1 Tax=Priestia aryabhattai TaxID=412384 RepID=UPI0035AB8E73
MEQATDLILKLLRYCEVNKIFDGKVDKKIFEQIYPHFKSCCLLSKHYRWLFNKSKSFFEKFPDSLERRHIRKAMYLDFNYTKNIDCSNFKFSSYIIHNYDDEFHEKFRGFFEEFYDKFFSSNREKGFNNRHQFKEEYSKENLIVSLVCPACLGDLNLSKAQLDHYFPKSLYPALIIQPYNLVPICSDCNTSMGTKENQGKGSKVPTSPLDNKKHNEEGCLRTVFIPYQRSGYKKITSSVLGKPGHRNINVKALKKEEEDIKLQVENHVNTFNINKVWTDRLPIINNIIVHQAVVDFRWAYCELVKTSGKGAELSHDQIKSYLWEKYIHDSDKIVYQIGNRFLLANYAAWLYQSSHGFEVFFREVHRRLHESMSSSAPEYPHYYEEDAESQDEE